MEIFNRPARETKGETSKMEIWKGGDMDRCSALINAGKKPEIAKTKREPQRPNIESRHQIMGGKGKAHTDRSSASTCSDRAVPR